MSMIEDVCKQQRIVPFFAMNWIIIIQNDGCDMMLVWVYSCNNISHVTFVSVSGRKYDYHEGNIKMCA